MTNAERLTSVLFVRVDKEMLAELDAIADAEKAKHPGRGCSRSDVVRELLAMALERRCARKRGLKWPW